MINEKTVDKETKYLLHFKNIYDFFSYLKNLYRADKWEIKSDSYKDRAKKLKDKKYYITLKELYEKNISNKDCTNQIVSFLDTLSLLQWTLAKIENETIYNETNILIEYQIPIKSKHRIDYILSFRDKIIILEFSKTNNIDEMSQLANQKQQQANGYITDLKNTLKKNIEIYANSFIYLPDDQEETFFEINKQNVIDTAYFIKQKFTEDENAIEQLLK